MKKRLLFCATVASLILSMAGCASKNNTETETVVTAQPTISEEESNSITNQLVNEEEQGEATNQEGTNQEATNQEATDKDVTEAKQQGEDKVDLNNEESAYDSVDLSKLTSFDYVKEMGMGINLGNTMEAFWENLSNETSGSSIIGNNTPQKYETCWGAIVTTQEMIDGIRDAGFQTVRIPVYWGNMMENDGTYTINESYFERVDEIIQYCLNDDLFVVINIHHYDEYLIKHKEQEEAVRIIANLWSQIANHYKVYPDSLIFEGFNENLGSYKENAQLTEEDIYRYVNELNQTFVDAVRQSGGKNENRMLIASGYWTNIDKTTDSRYHMPTDTANDRLMVSVHYIDNAMYWTNQIGGKTWLDYSKAQCELLKKAFIDQGIPVFVGECTSFYEDARFDANAEYTNSSECLSIMMNMAVDYGFVPVLWDTNGGVYSRTEYKLKSDSDQAVITEISNKIKEK